MERGPFGMERVRFIGPHHFGKVNARSQRRPLATRWLIFSALPLTIHGNAPLTNPGPPWGDSGNDSPSDRGAIRLMSTPTKKMPR